ncbi:MAG TPA: hypothetical protein V6C76_02110 [Drouetiella sp.]
MELDTRHQNKDGNVVSDFGRGLYDSAVQQPVDGVRQLFGAHVEPKNDKDSSIAYKVGETAGFVVDFTILSKVTGAARTRIFGDPEKELFAFREVNANKEKLAPILNSSINMGVSGGIYGGIFTPSSNDKNLLQGRLENGLVSGVSFAAMGGVSQAIEPLGMFGKSQLVNRVGNNAIAGGIGGAISSIGSVYFAEHRMATLGEIGSGTAENALFGAGFGALGHGIDKVTEHPKVRDKYYTTKWELERAGTEAKRKYYGMLDSLDMRHPVWKLGDILTGSKSLLATERPQLTSVNNPAVAMERELPKYYDRADKMEEQAEEASKDRSNRDARYNSMMAAREMRTQFGEQLMKWWHGTETEPGFKQYSDSELATPEVPVERVAAMRDALTAQGRENPIGERLANLAGRDNEYHNDVLDGIEIAKGRFFGYDERALEKKMAMPSEHFVKDRDGLSPMSWMPFESTGDLANLFHGTVSGSLPGVFAERGMLPSAEMRVRGLSHLGEAHNDQFGRRAISLTRDFNEGWAYHRHSPFELDTYPVVFGISVDVAGKMKTAGFLEPGEQLVDRLRLGSNLGQRLGLQKPEITHIYVPDSKIPEVQNMLKAYRIQDVSVVGVNALEAPNWKSVPKFSDEVEANEWLRSAN